MNFDTPSYQPDPTLTAEQAAAQAEKVNTIRDRVSGLTDNLIRTFGARQSFSGGLTKAPILGF